MEIRNIEGLRPYLRGYNLALLDEIKRAIKDAARELKTIEAITVSPTPPDELMELVNRLQMLVGEVPTFDPKKLNQK